MQDAEQDGALTIAQAAAQLGVSVDTVRRRIRRGELAAQQVPTQRGPAWRVKLGSMPSGMPTVGSTPGSTPMQDEAPHLAALVRELADRAERNAAAAAMWQARAELLASQLEQAQRALEAPQDAQEAPYAAQDANPDQEAQNAAQERSAPRRPWWAFWRA